MKSKKKPTKKGRTWADHYTHKAKAERFPARSVYKLKEIQQKHGIIRKGDRVLDLGCSPGSWLLYAAQIVGANGHVVGVDLKPVDERLPPNAEARIGDVLSHPAELIEQLHSDFAVVLSDMAPNTTGHKGVDADRSEALCEAALHVAEKTLKHRGAFVCKIFQGSGFQDFVKKMRGGFGRVQIYKPKSSRTQSREIYIIGMDRRGNDSDE